MHLPRNCGRKPRIRSQFGSDLGLAFPRASDLQLHDGSKPRGEYCPQGNPGSQLFARYRTIHRQLSKANYSHRRKGANRCDQTRVPLLVFERPTDVQTGIAQVADIERCCWRRSTRGDRRERTQSPAEADVDHKSRAPVDRKLVALALQHLAIDPRQKSTRPNPFFCLVPEQRRKRPGALV